MCDFFVVCCIVWDFNELLYVVCCYNFMGDFFGICVNELKFVVIELFGINWGVVDLEYKFGIGRNLFCYFFWEGFDLYFRDVGDEKIFCFIID